MDNVINLNPPSSKAEAEKMVDILFEQAVRRGVVLNTSTTDVAKELIESVRGINPTNLQNEVIALFEKDYNPIVHRLPFILPQLLRFLTIAKLNLILAKSCICLDVEEGDLDYGGYPPVLVSAGLMVDPLDDGGIPAGVMLFVRSFVFDTSPEYTDKNALCYSPLTPEDEGTRHLNVPLEFGWTKGIDVYRPGTFPPMVLNRLIEDFTLNGILTNGGICYREEGSRHYISYLVPMDGGVVNEWSLAIEKDIYTLTNDPF